MRRWQIHCLPKAVTERHSVQAGMLGAHENVNVPVKCGLMDAHRKHNLRRFCLYVHGGLSNGWLVERLDSGHSTFNCAAVNAGVPLGRIAVQWSDLERQVPFWELGRQAIGS